MKGLAGSGLALLALCTSLAGCASDPVPRDRFYRLDPGAVRGLPSPLLDGMLEVDRLGSDAVSGERALLHRADASSPELRQYPYHYWVDSPTLMLQRGLVAYLREARVARRVVTPELRLEPDYHLSGRLLRLERLTGSTPARSVVEVELGLTRGSELILLQTYEAEQGAAGPDIADSVRAFQAAWTAVLERFVSELARTAGR